MTSTSRTDAVEFARRTLKNLRYLEDAHKRGEDVHIVTQLANSLLGLIVFPWEKNFVSRIETLAVADFAAKGWPNWNVTLGSCSTLGELARHVRNAVAHGHIFYSSDGYSDFTVVLTVTDCHPKSGTPHWRASIRAEDLRRFCERLIELIEDTLG